MIFIFKNKTLVDRKLEIILLITFLFEKNVFWNIWLSFWPIVFDLYYKSNIHSEFVCPWLFLC